MSMRNSRLLALSLLAVTGSPAVAQAPTTIQVQLANFSFTPKKIVLDHGHSYVLRLTNVASGGHDFTAKEFFSASAVAPDDRALVAEGEVEVPSGQVREIHLTAPAKAGRYRLKCSHTFHKMFGMSGEIVVR
jgi:uncharacterized cupredoxin-like copper-binding protein